ncbi:MAG: nucleotidyltransferase family protein [Mariniphaga sp.]
MELINKHISEIKNLCEKFHVAELYVFGSVTKENFSASSDIDFLVQFENVDPREYFDNYMDLKERLEKLLSRDVDLVEIQTLKNPILKRSIDRNKIFLYGREDSKVAV